MQNLKKSWLVVSNMTWGIWWIFNHPLKSLKISLWWALFIQSIKVSYLSWHWTAMQSLNKTWMISKMTQKRLKAIKSQSENLHFDRLLLSKGYKVLDEKVQKSYLSWHWRMMQSLNKNWLLVPKMTWGIWWTLTWAVESLKTCTLMDYFCQKCVMFELKKYRRSMS